MTTATMQTATMQKTAGETAGETEQDGKTAGPLRIMQAELDLRALHHWMAERWIREESIAMHQLLVETLGDLSPRPFRVKPKPGGARGTLLGYSTSTVEEIALEAEAYAGPLESRVIRLETLADKEMPREWHEGRELGFEVRTRPVVRPQRDPERVTEATRQGHADGRLRPGLNCDALLWESVRREGMGEEEIPVREEVYPEWLAERFKKQGGALVDPGQVIVLNYRETREVAPKGKRGWMLPDVVMRGKMRVSDPGKFRELLALGIGRHRAFGFGMVLLNPILSR